MILLIYAGDSLTEMHAGFSSDFLIIKNEKLVSLMQSAYYVMLKA
ncbi:hypothetical protein ACFL1T_02540 [Chlamydiota bacterium]